MQIHLGEIYQDLLAKLREAEIAAAELRGQVQLIERLLADARQPTMSGDSLQEDPAP